MDSRYARQTVLDDIGQDGQDALSRSRILIVGLGGLGCPASLYLAAAGVGHIGLIDADQVSLSNLQRQVLFQTGEVGQSKVEIAKMRLLALNPSISVASYPEFMHEKNAQAIANDYDLILDGSDNFSTKYLLSALSHRLQKPLIYGSVLRFAAQVAVFWPGRSSCYRCLFPHPPEQHVPNCAEAGVLGALAGMIGSVQALEAIKVAITLGTGRELPGLKGQLLQINARSMRTQTIALQKDPDCLECSRAPEAIILPKVALGCATRSFTASEVQAGLPEAFVYLDVREQQEWDRGHLPGAVHLPLSRLVEGELPDLKQDQALLIYCQSGVRSLKAQVLLEERGWSQIVQLRGGLSTWTAELSNA